MRGAVGQGGIQEEITPNYTNSYTDNFQSQESICEWKRESTKGSTQNTKVTKFC